LRSNDAVAALASLRKLSAESHQKEEEEVSPPAS